MPIPHPEDLHRWDQVAHRCAARVVRGYSTSFGLGISLLPPAVARDICHLYAVVRIADEIVDGTGTQAGLSPTDIRAALDHYEQCVLQAPSQRFHTDPIMHAYADTAARCHFPEHLIRSFFSSMRQDICVEPQGHSYSPEELSHYIYGSAEVIGLLCVAVFAAHDSSAPWEKERQGRVDTGARALGAAFQKINFLRDIGADYQQLHRTYLPGISPDDFHEDALGDLLVSITKDLDSADSAIKDLPAFSQPAVASISALFRRLHEELSSRTISEIMQSRVRISNAEKLKIVLKAVTYTQWRNYRKEK
ncbi:squalene/phytoene synthase family protein [Corynebacterium sp. 3HC-13]|uniref:phytoene/squalene synthase family protein n=1 Tax=Corynebacterium poyangense TaxID=2684405 RepID=UPI001CCD9F1B|nr:phytoene/squalene synthase family protein [Corynebacterium poyangense]MBZ8176857.1 squalene/phytoene synthase family protein [Corynebacterium poyangense]